MSHRFKLSPSLMCADMIRLHDDLALFEKEGIEYLHIDVMDGHYVPNMALGPQLCEQIAGVSTIPLDVHLMVENVDEIVPVFAATNPAVMTFHPETSRHPVRTMEHIAALGVQPGVAIDPAVPIHAFQHLYAQAAVVLVMTVNPGYSGQKLLPWTLDKISELVDLRARHDYSFEIEVDGNCSWDNIPKMVDAGADIIVAGSSSLFSSSMDREEAAIKMRLLR